MKLTDIKKKSKFIVHKKSNKLGYIKVLNLRHIKISKFNNIET
jgi:hypothetical protein